MSGIRTNAAAVMLGISPNTLRSWERRYDFPAPHRSPGGHRQYGLAEIEALRQALAETHNVSSAISLAKERGEGPSSPRRLVAAFSSYNEDQANRLLEESLSLRSVERTVEEVLLAALTSLSEADPGGAEYEFAWRHATGWLSAMKRLAPPATVPEGLLIIDGAHPQELDSLHAQALELFLRRAGIRTLLLGAGTEPQRLTRALRALTPSAMILAGRRCSLDQIGRLVYAARRVVEQVSVFDFRDAVPDTGASTVRRLGHTPLQAREALLSALPHASEPHRQPAAPAIAPASRRHPIGATG